MTVSSYLELFTTLYGWLFYNTLWGVLVGTGIVFLPFLGIIIDNVIQPYTSQESKDATVTSLRRMEIDLFMAMVVVVLAGQPSALTPMSPKILSYTPAPTLSNPAPTPNQTVAANDTDYGSSGFAGAAGVTVNIPVFWYATMSVAEGLNNAIINGLPSIADLRDYENAVRAASIKDPQLAQEVNEFYSQCFVPARSKFLRDQPNVTALTTTWGLSDTEWIGSHVYLSTPGYYDSFRALYPIPGVVYVPARDTEYNDIPGYAGPGRPYCNQWWLGTGPGSHSLKTLLVNQYGLDTYATGALTAVGALATISTARRQDNEIRAVMLQGPANWSSDYYANANSTGSLSLLSDLGHFGEDVSAGVGTGIAAMMQGTFMHVILYALPMVQALLLMCIYALLPLVLVISRYSFSFMILAALGIISVKFFSVLWHFAAWVDNNLIYSMYPNADALTLLFTTEQGPKRWLLDMLTTGLYLGLPVIWTGMMGWAGLTIGKYLNQQMSVVTAPANEASKASTSVAKSVTGSALGDYSGTLRRRA